eukprot:ANDGO_07289.mRNA.1 hypothetical protein
MQNGLQNTLSDIGSCSAFQDLLIRLRILHHGDHSGVEQLLQRQNVNSNFNVGGMRVDQTLIPTLLPDDFIVSPSDCSTQYDSSPTLLTNVLYKFAAQTANPEVEHSFVNAFHGVDFDGAGMTAAHPEAGSHRMPMFPLLANSNDAACKVSTPPDTPIKPLRPQQPRLGTLEMGRVPVSCISASAVNQTTILPPPVSIPHFVSLSASDVMAIASAYSGESIANPGMFSMSNGPSGSSSSSSHSSTAGSPHTQPEKIPSTRDATENTNEFDFLDPALDWSIPAIPGLCGWSVQTKTGRTSFHNWTSAVSKNQPEDAEWYKTSMYTMQLRMELNPFELPALNELDLTTICGYEMELSLVGHEVSTDVMEEGLRFTCGGPFHLKRKETSTWIGRTDRFQPTLLSFINIGMRTPFRLRLSIHGLSAHRARVAEWNSVSPVMSVKSKKRKHWFSSMLVTNVRVKRDRETAATDGADSANDENDDELPWSKRVFSAAR